MSEKEHSMKTNHQEQSSILFNTGYNMTCPNQSLQSRPGGSELDEVEDQLVVMDFFQNETTNVRKRKASINEDSEDEFEGNGKRSSEESRRHNHSEIEKRRRDKMNTYITELSSMIPICHAMSRKLDKLTVLRMAVQHMKTIRGATNSYSNGYYKPTFLSEKELKLMILKAAEGFMFVVGCDRGRVLYVSDSVSKVLTCNQADILGQNWFDIIHPKDVAKVKEQLSSPDICPRERFIDAKTMLPLASELQQGLPKLCTGARRSFFCRMKFKPFSTAQIKEESDTSSSSQNSTKPKTKVRSDRKYRVIHCTGYLKAWPTTDDQDCEYDVESSSVTCLVAVGRIPSNILNSNYSRSLEHQPSIHQIQFISRHAIDGKFLFVDQRATLVLGYLPQELLGTSMYEYYHPEDISSLAETHKLVLQNTEEVTTPVYRFKSKCFGFTRLQSEWKSFKNPWTRDIEYLIAKNYIFI